MSKITENLNAINEKIERLLETRKNMERKIKNLEEELIINQADLIKLNRQKALLENKLNSEE